MGIAENVRNRRKALRLSQPALSKKSGVPQTTISAIETGNRMPTADTIMMLAKGLACTSDELLQGEKMGRKKLAASNGDELRQEIAILLDALPDEELSQIRDYATYLISRRGK